MTLGATTAVVVIGLAAVTALRIQRRNVSNTMDFVEARVYAQSAIDLGMRIIISDDTWRGSYANGPWTVDAPIGRGTYSLDVVDPVDGDFTDNPGDSVFLTGTGKIGDARYRLNATVLAELSPLSCLEASLHTGNDLSFTNAVVFGDQIISANDSVSESGSTVNPNVEAVNAINGSGYTGTTTPGITARSMPDPATVFDYYVDNGTSITVPGYLIENKLLSPTSNPYGPTDPQGIYVVDCQSQVFTIVNTRIVGTLVLLSAGTGSQIKPAVNLEPAVSDFPVLLVEGSFTVDTGSQPLSEPLTGINFNPTGTPYNTAEDGDIDDTYPAVVNGLVYVSVDLATNNDAAFQGVVIVGNTFTGAGNVTVNYGSDYLANPPRGFTEPPKMLISQGSWKQLVD